MYVLPSTTTASPVARTSTSQWLASDLGRAAGMRQSVLFTVYLPVRWAGGFPAAFYSELYCQEVLTPHDNVKYNIIDYIFCQYFLAVYYK